MKNFYTTLLLIIISFNCFSQVFTNKPIGKKGIILSDSIKSTEYPFVLPLLGKKAAAAGFDLPYPVGMSVNYLWQESSLRISNLKVGVNGSEQFNLDQIVRFNDATATSTGLNFRPDFWLFPFLNVYGIIAASNTSTEVDFGIFLPDENGYQEIFNYRTIAEFEATSFGFGMTPTIGVGGGWMALDMNFTWTDIPELEKPAFAFIFGPRIGKSFDLRRKDRNINFWVGGFRIQLRSDTEGNIALSKILPEDGNFEDRIFDAQNAVIDKQAEVDEWWNGLTPLEQQLNERIYDAAIAGLQGANELLTRLEAAGSRVESSTIQYSLDKGQEQLWNFVVGSQFQLNKNWMIRMEYGFLGSRNQLIAGLQYRFGL